MNSNWNLNDIAHQAMIQRGLNPDFSDEVAQQLDHLSQPAADLNKTVKDLRHFLWFSIDNDDSLDLDQITYAELLPAQQYRIYIAIADVDSLVPKSSPIDNHACQNTTSVYTPTIVFPMLPEKLSNHLTSLNANEDRLAMVVEITLNEEGATQRYDVYQAYVRNYAKLAYNTIGPWLEKKTPPPESIAKIEGLDKQIQLQDQITTKLKKNRYHAGALSFKTIQAEPILKNSHVEGFKVLEKNRARDLIENFMVAANTCVTKFLEKKQVPTFRRVVRIPKRWDRIVELADQSGEKLPANPDSKALSSFLTKMQKADLLRFPDLSLAVIKLLGRGEYVVEPVGAQNPEGHFALALSDYSHTTAPNRRYPDLINQRLIKSSLGNQSLPYTLEELTELAQHCTEKEVAAEKVERHMFKSTAALFLTTHLQETFDGIVTGISENAKDAWVRIFTYPIEGKLVTGSEGLDVGDRLKVKLVHVDVPNGYIDFVRAYS